MEKIEIGKIVNTHGIRGEVKLIPYLDDPDVFREFDTVIADGKEYKVLGTKFAKGNPVYALEGVDSVDAANALRNKTVFVYESDLPKLSEGEFYIKDILGMEAISDQDVPLGVISDVFRTGSNDVYEITGEDKNKILIPAISEVIKSIDIEGKKLTVHLIEGLI